MRLNQLQNLPRREDPSELYELTQISFRFPDNSEINFPIGEYYVTKDTEMRMDLICYEIYGNVDNIDFLCSLNNIKNPLAIRRGMSIIYTSTDAINQFNVLDIDKNEVRRVISNKRKQFKPDPNRIKYLEESTYSLPPTITKKDYTPVKNRNGRTYIGSNIFNV